MTNTFMLWQSTELGRQSKVKNDDVESRMRELMQPIDQQIYMCDNPEDMLMIACAMLQRVREIFDENLGVGARIGVGEDTEMSLRLRDFTGESPYFPILVQHHPYKPGKYSPEEKFQFLAYLAVRDFKMYFSLIRYTLRIIMLERMNFILCVKLYLVELKYWKYARK